MTKLTAPKTTRRAVAIPQSRQEVERSFASLGALRAALAAKAAEHETRIGTLTEAFAAEVAPLEADIRSLEAQIQAFCEAHKAGLTNDGKRKTVKFINGSVNWKEGKPRVELTAKEEEIVAALKKLRLGKAFVRVSESINKQAVLDEPERVAKVPGLKVVRGPETFAIAVKTVDVDDLGKERV